MSDINVFVDDQQMTITNNPVIASGGVNEDYVVFTFSEEWDDFEKVACFYKDGEEENVVEMLVDENNKALIPHEVTDEPGKFWFGVVGIKNDITYTSEVLWYDLRKGIYEKESRSATADIYVQMLELAQQIVEHLNNTPYTTFEEDGEFELPIHTINDSAISNESTWSSSKITDEISAIIDDSQEAETSETTTISAHKLFGIVSQLNQNIDGIYNDVVTLNSQKWRYIGTLNNSDTRSLRIDFTEAETSTVIILTINNVNAEGNNVFVSRKTMITPELTGVPAWQIAGVDMNQDEIMILGSYNDGNPFISVTNNTPTGSGIGCAVYIMYLN